MFVRKCFSVCRTHIKHIVFVLKSEQQTNKQTRVYSTAFSLMHAICSTHTHVGHVIYFIHVGKVYAYMTSLLTVSGVHALVCVCVQCQYTTTVSTVTLYIFVIIHFLFTSDTNNVLFLTYFYYCVNKILSKSP